MDAKKTLEKLESDLSAYLISEIPREFGAGTNRSRQIYMYKGLTISANLTKPIVSKTLSIRIGALEAEFQSETGERVSGSLAPDDEHLVRVWLTQSKIFLLIRTLFLDGDDDDDDRRSMEPIGIDDDDF